MRSRGQVLPMWIIGTISTFSLMFLAMNYANAIRYQIRAQNAADSAAAALVSIQAQRWNEMEAALYSANIEEYRFRRLLDTMLLATDASGGCLFNPYTIYNQYSVDPQSCNRVFIDTHDPLMRSAVRYGADVQQLNNVTATASFANVQTEDANVLASLKAYCNNSVRAVTQANVNAVNSGGGDCAFTYKLLDSSVRTGLGNVMQDAVAVYIPSEGTNLSGASNANVAYFSPMRVDVLVCATVPPIVPKFGWINIGSYVASARAAATNVMLEQDWLQPGTVVDSQRANGQVFQPNEVYTANNPYDYFNVDFGGSNAVAYVGANQFVAPINNNELDSRLGWWGPISITPYATAQSC